MFESICITQQNKSDYSSQLDIGFLAETLLFYQSVRVIGDAGVLEQLIKRCGVDALFQLLEAGLLKFTFVENTTGIRTLDRGTTNELHAPATVGAFKNTFQEAAPKFFEEASGHRGKGRRLANHLVKKIEINSFDSTLLNKVVEDFENEAYLREASAALIALIAPEYRPPSEIEFRLERVNDNFRVHTNVNFQDANKSFVKHVPQNFGELTPALFLSYIIDVRKNLDFAVQYESEIATHQVISRLIKVKFSTILTSSDSEAQIGNFEDLVLDDSRALRESINNGERTFSQFLQILEKAEKFRHWLHGQPKDANLVKAYFREVTKSTWIDTLPGKIARWTFFTGTPLLVGLGLGALGMPIGVILSAADTFLVDGLVRGWRPDQFIESSLIPFVKNKSTK